MGIQPYVINPLIVLNCPVSTIKKAASMAAGSLTLAPDSLSVKFHNLNVKKVLTYLRIVPVVKQKFVFPDIFLKKG